MSSANFCSACGKALPQEAQFCNQCGFAVAQLAHPPAPQKDKWYHHPVVGLFMLFVVLQVFGLPLVWKNPRFSRSTKIVLTVLTILETAVLTFLTFGAVKTIFDHMLSESSELKSLLAY